MVLTIFPSLRVIIRSACIMYHDDVVYLQMKENGKTALLKAVLHLKDGKNDSIQVLLDIAEKCGHLEELVNASYNDESYKGRSRSGPLLMTPRRDL